MSDGVTGLPSTGYVADVLYRVKPMDRDAGGKSGERFEHQLKKEEKESGEDGQEPADAFSFNPSASLPAEFAVPRDSMILSDDALKVLGKNDDGSVSPDSSVVPGGKLPENSEDNEPSGPHIDVTA